MDREEMDVEWKYVRNRRKNNNKRKDCTTMITIMKETVCLNIFV